MYQSNNKTRNLDFEEFETFQPNVLELDRVYIVYKEKLKANILHLSEAHQCLCEKFLISFDNARDDEKFERNCLALLLIEQVIKLRTICEPFCEHIHIGKEIHLKDLYCKYFQQSSSRFIHNNNHNNNNSAFSYHQNPNNQYNCHLPNNVNKIEMSLIKQKQQQQQQQQQLQQHQHQQQPHHNQPYAAPPAPQLPSKQFEPHGDDSSIEDKEEQEFLESLRTLPQNELDLLFAKEMCKNLYLLDKVEKLKGRIFAVSKSNREKNALLSQYAESKKQFETNLNININNMVLKPLLKYIKQHEYLPKVKATKTLKFGKMNKGNGHTTRTLKNQKSVESNAASNEESQYSLSNYYKIKIESIQKGLPIVVFDKIFANILPENGSFHTEISQCDKKFNHLVMKEFNAKYERKLKVFYNKAEKKICKAKSMQVEKFQERLSFVNWSHKLQMKLVRLKCYSEMRNMFVDVRLLEKLTIEQLIEHIENRCNEVFSEI